MDTFLDWPGKSPPPGSEVYHPAAYHMLDVGAVLELLLQRAGFDGPVREALCLLGTLHDIGKIGNGFRAMLQEGANQGDRHWRVSMAWFDHFDESLFEPIMENKWQVRFPLYAASAGHHGGPPEGDQYQLQRMVQQAGPDAERDACLFVQSVAALFPNANLSSLTLSLKKAEGDWQRSAKALSWWFAGAVSVADWIGSNTEWFPATEKGPSIEEYWCIAQVRAECALCACGIAKATPSECSAQTLFDFASFTPMQSEALSVSLPQGQTLAIVEDATGSGKTEAALMLAHRMMQAGKGSGIFFAMPTMATANAMLPRLAAMGKMFDGAPSLALTQSRAYLDEQFQQILGRRQSEPGEELSCSDWFADGRRKALLAHIGVGTVDQALLGALPTRYFALRLYALSRQILIVDEAHDYDAYMQAELEALLTFHAMLGGSAVLMTATLPKQMRQKFANAFQKGAYKEECCLDSDAYPQLSIIADEVASFAVEPVVETVRNVPVIRVDSLDSVLGILENRSKAGAACAFVRNSVDEAIAAVEALRARGVEAMLHHARFALCDRWDNEQRVLERFGKDGQARAGAVIVGTQVLEQSLDIDFDVMVSDLAPMGALIQRAGRLWRHMSLRPASTRPVAGPLLYVLSPDPDMVSDSNWLLTLLGKGQFVYAPALQWRTAKALFSAGAIGAPGGLRGLIEAAEGEGGLAVPEGLSPAESKQVGDGQAERQQGLANTLNPLDDYRSAASVFEDEIFPTRLGQEQVRLVLARRTEQGLEPWAQCSDPGQHTSDADRSWALSEVSVSRSRWNEAGGRDQDAPEIAAIRLGWEEWKQAGTYVCPVGEDGLITEQLRYDAALGLVFPPRTAS